MCNDNLLRLSYLYNNFLHNSLKWVTLSKALSLNCYLENFFLLYKLLQSEWFIIKDQQPVTILF